MTLDSRCDIARRASASIRSATCRRCRSAHQGQAHPIASSGVGKSTLAIADDRGPFPR